MGQNSKIEQASVAGGHSSSFGLGGVAPPDEDLDPERFHCFADLASRLLVPQAK